MQVRRRIQRWWFGPLDLQARAPAGASSPWYRLSSCALRQVAFRFSCWTTSAIYDYVPGPQYAPNPRSTRLPGRDQRVRRLLDELRKLREEWFASANLRETDLAAVHVGDCVTVYSMTDRRVAIRGAVDSIGWGVLDQDRINLPRSAPRRGVHSQET